ncbi:MAG TPA: EscU/YscU/HrcU family type III secretion system export apparatus switch protein [Candidatus Hydrogenedentes bacterium]|nr:EscU/YscU/HrcU family type III secretion system export apparatus switch protein [Candidatus Hydrogenedentota bacterium]HOL76519.1 EscU/YscU/HrcU family type III secretion system export apparatus switch protein [Candidatus Hydrogenedentota bacterium]HPO85183.1 EscU/YscU/HrcU family type III secretion system export apparatus switch protein [Candidatus Hydrogenedentota bacterium]
MSKENRNAYRRAVALRYDPTRDSAPKVTAKGDRLLAEKIIALAREHGIHIHEDPDLVAVLAKVGVDLYIPEDLYRAVAEILAFVYRLNNKIPPAIRPQNP